MVVRRTKAQWAEIMNEYKKSGQTMASWCKENGVNVKTLGAHMIAEGKTPKKGRTLDEWKLLIEKRKSSGMGYSAWCKANGVNKNTMFSAEKRIARSQKAKEKNLNQGANSTEAEWIEVKIPGNNETFDSVPSYAASNDSVDVFSVKPSSVSEQLPDRDNADCITKPANTIQTLDKDIPVHMRIRLKNLEIEVGDEYPATKLIAIIKELMN
jgi:transposase-like protein